MIIGLGIKKGKQKGQEKVAHKSNRDRETRRRDGQGDDDDGGTEAVSAGDGEADRQVSYEQSPDQEYRHTGRHGGRTPISIYEIPLTMRRYS